MSGLEEQLGCAIPLLRWLSQGFDKNWSSNLQEPYVMIAIDYDVAMELPPDMDAWMTRRQETPVSEPVFSVPAGILAKYALGEFIPAPRQTWT